MAFLLALWSGIVVVLAAQSPGMLMQTLSSPPSWVLPGAALDFNFANGSYWNSGASTTLSVTRATTETCTSLGGTLSYVAANIPCITDAGLQVWQSSVNLILQSQFSASWTATRSTLTPNAVVSPDTTANAATLVEDSSATDTHLAVQSVTKAASALAYTFSVYAKSSTRTRIALQIDDNAGNGAIMVCDLAGQQIGVAAAGVGTPFTTISSAAIRVGAWTRCSISGTTNTATVIRGNVFLDNGAGTAALSNSYSGNGSSGVPIFGAQLEQNTMATASPYIPTTTVSATRNLTNVSRPIVVGPVYGVFFAGTPELPIIYPTNSQTLLSIDDGTTNNRFSMFRNATTGASAILVNSGGVTQYNTSGSVWAQNIFGKMAMSTRAGLQRGAFNGVALTSGSGATLTVSPTLLHFGERADASNSTQWSGTVSRIAVFNSFTDGLINITQ